MSKVVHFFQLRMLPPGINLGLLVLRLGLGLSLLFLHGWSKLAGYSTMGPSFADPWGLGGPFTLGLSILAEVVCSSLVVLGLFTRFAALICVINMLCALYYVHGFALSGPASGELALVYLFGFLAILLAGPGRFALDRGLGGTTPGA